MRRKYRLGWQLVNEGGRVGESTQVPQVVMREQRGDACEVPDRQRHGSTVLVSVSSDPGSNSGRFWSED